MIAQVRKTRIGEVVSDKTDKTVVVAVQWYQRHPLYHKRMRRITRFYVHDETNECRLGDQVVIVESRPISKNKRWRIQEILSRREVPDIQPREVGVDLEQAVPAPVETPAEAEEPQSAVAVAVEETPVPAAEVEVAEVEAEAVAEEETREETPAPVAEVEEAEAETTEGEEAQATEDKEEQSS
jgi:small subunit ribosomal protein S17